MTKLSGKRRAREGDEEYGEGVRRNGGGSKENKKGTPLDLGPLLTQHSGSSCGGSAPRRKRLRLERELDVPSYVFRWRDFSKENCFETAPKEVRAFQKSLISSLQQCEDDAFDRAFSPKKLLEFASYAASGEVLHPCIVHDCDPSDPFKRRILDQIYGAITERIGDEHFKRLTPDTVDEVKTWVSAVTFSDVGEKITSKAMKRRVTLRNETDEEFLARNIPSSVTTPAKTYPNVLFIEDPFINNRDTPFKKITFYTGNGDTQTELAGIEPTKSITSLENDLSTTTRFEYFYDYTTVLHDRLSPLAVTQISMAKCSSSDRITWRVFGKEYDKKRGESIGPWIPLSTKRLNKKPTKKDPEEPSIPLYYDKLTLRLREDSGEEDRGPLYLSFKVEVVFDRSGYDVKYRQTVLQLINEISRSRENYSKIPKIVLVTGNAGVPDCLASSAVFSPKTGAAVAKLTALNVFHLPLFISTLASRLYTHFPSPFFPLPLTELLRDFLKEGLVQNYDSMRSAVVKILNSYVERMACRGAIPLADAIVRNIFKQRRHRLAFSGVSSFASSVKVGVHDTELGEDVESTFHLPPTTSVTAVKTVISSRREIQLLCSFIVAVIERTTELEERFHSAPTPQSEFHADSLTGEARLQFRNILNFTDPTGPHREQARKGRFMQWMSDLFNNPDQKANAKIPAFLTSILSAWDENVDEEDPQNNLWQTFSDSTTPVPVASVYIPALHCLRDRLACYKTEVANTKDPQFASIIGIPQPDILQLTPPRRVLYYFATFRVNSEDLERVKMSLVDAAEERGKQRRAAVGQAKSRQAWEEKLVIRQIAKEALFLSGDNPVVFSHAQFAEMYHGMVHAFRVHDRNPCVGVQPLQQLFAQTQRDSQKGPQKGVLLSFRKSGAGGGGGGGGGGGVEVPKSFTLGNVFYRDPSTQEGFKFSQCSSGVAVCKAN